MGANDSRHTEPHSVALGSEAESLACQYLQQRGLRLVDKNYSCHGGEIDLIMRDGEYLVFVEVRLRHNEDYGHSLETISASKQKRIIRTALTYLQETEQMDTQDCRFDAIGISDKDEIIWLQDAFQA